ncbi:MAG: hypothetical protein MUF54_17045 [Polyangiaceae bacterium]|jgi:hypothetical protein|nr:hypothetical protein [Polyangiaceae bacterium]
MKLFVHQIGKHRLRCQFENAEQARKLWDQFVPMVLMHVFGMKGLDPETAELPAIHGQGFVFEGQLLTAFGQRYDVVIVDSAGVKAMAERVQQASPTEQKRRTLPVLKN